MGAYGVSVVGVAAAAGAALATIHTGTNRIKIVKFGIFNTTAVTTTWALYRPTNTPVATTSVLGQALGDSTAASLTNVDTAWSTAPTVGSVAIDGMLLPASVAAGYVDTWRSDRPLELAANSWLVVWNPSGSTVAVPRILFEWDE